MHTQENWELGLYEVIDQIWDNIRNKVKGSRLGKKRKCEENNKTRKKLMYLKKSKKRLNVENPDRVEDRTVNSCTKIRIHNVSST